MTMSVRKTATILVIAALAGAAAAQFSGCEKYILPEIELSRDTLLFSAAHDSITVHVTTNVITTAEAQDDGIYWIDTDPPWFDESSVLVVTVKENTTGEERTGVIPVKSESITKNIVVIQAAE